ncbi:MAG: SUMF1/EgtB/PvdO family nonheme iron enzyme [bacterium]
MRWLWIGIVTLIIFGCTKSKTTDPEPPPPSDQVTVTQPEQGDLFYWDSTAIITWMTEGSVDQVNIYYRIEEDSSWILIDSNISSLSYNWTIPEVTTNKARIKVEYYADTSVYDLNPGNFVLDQYLENNLILLTCDSFFYMGSDSTEAGHVHDEFPIHKVSLSGFYIDINEVTNSEYKSFCNQTGYPYPTDPGFTGMSNYFDSFPDYPVVMVSWQDAARFCNWLSGRDGLELQYDTTDWSCRFTNGYRLPTEAEWEFAARGGLYQCSYPWGDESPGDHCNWANDLLYPYTSPIRSFDQNGFGLYDMAGNVLEWTNDFYSSNYYPNSPQQDPHGPSTGMYKVIRGGSWFDGEANLRCACRNPAEPNCADIFIKANTLGFRVVRGF